MAIRDILLLGNPVLRKKCLPVGDLSDRRVAAVITDLRDTLMEFRARHMFGRGIASAQIGSDLRIIFTNIDRPQALINPVITHRSTEMMTLWDDCFSFPDILVKVRRHLDIIVRYYDENGNQHTVEATAGLSELLQHEIDHLDGILAIDRAIDSRHIILRSEYRKMVEHQKYEHPL